jgi:hypothetical protein
LRKRIIWTSPKPTCKLKPLWRDLIKLNLKETISRNRSVNFLELNRRPRRQAD